MKYIAPRRLHWLLLISAVIIFLDRLTKTWVTLHIPMGGAIPVIPRVLRITHWTNEGAAFSLFANSASPQAVRWVLICFSLLAALMVLFLLVRLGDRFTFTTVALALVFARRRSPGSRFRHCGGSQRDHMAGRQPEPIAGDP
jgi:signal peptidase II